MNCLRIYNISIDSSRKILVFQTYPFLRPFRHIRAFFYLSCSGLSRTSPPASSPGLTHLWYHPLVYPTSDVIPGFNPGISLTVPPQPLSIIIPALFLIIVIAGLDPNIHRHKALAHNMHAESNALQQKFMPLPVLRSSWLQLVIAGLDPAIHLQTSRQACNPEIPRFPGQAGE